MMSLEARRRVRIDPSDLLLEIISIMVAILLALGVNNVVENRKHHELLQQSLREIRAEIASNLAQIDAAHPYHARILLGFTRLLDANGRSEELSYTQISRTFQNSSASGFHLMVPENTAWTIAGSGGATEYMDHRLRTQLTKNYNVQGLMDSLQHQFLSTILYSAPAGGRNFYYATAGATQSLSDLVALEAQMRKLDETMLADLDAALR